MFTIELNKTIYTNDGTESAEAILERYRSYRQDGVVFKEEAEEWLNEYCPGWTYDESLMTITLLFNSADHLIMYKLRWGK